MTSDSAKDLAADSQGRLLAVSIGQPRSVTWHGDTIQTGIFKSPVDTPLRARRSGIEGDAQADLSVHGGIDKAVYAFDESAAAYWRDALDRPETPHGAFGENLSIDGWSEDQVRIGDRFRIGGARFEVSQPRQPCAKLGLRFDDPTLPKRFFKSGRVGFYLRVLDEGLVEAGNTVTREFTDTDALDIRSLVAIWLDRDASIQDLEHATAQTALAEAWKGPLSKRLAKQRPTLRP